MDYLLDVLCDFKELILIYLLIYNEVLKNLC